MKAVTIDEFIKKICITSAAHFTPNILQYIGGITCVVKWSFF